MKSEIGSLPVALADWQTMMADNVARLAADADNSDILRAFFPLPATASPIQLFEIQIDDQLWYRYFADGRVETASQKFDASFSDRLLYPLKLREKSALLIFLRTDGGRFTLQDKTLFGWLAQLAAPLLMGLISQQNMLAACQALSHERDDCRILVDITNAVLAHLDMDALVVETSRQIHHFFAMPAICLALHRPHHSQSYTTWISRYHPTGAIEHRCEQQEMSTSAVEQVLANNTPLLLSLTDDNPLWQSDPLLQDLAAQGMQVALLLPLAFSHHPPGVLLLAHQKMDAFTLHDSQLLGHIAARIGIAVDNANAWQQINDLKDSLKQENIWLNEQIHHTESFGDIIYQSDAMKNVLMQLEMVAQSDSTALLLGETGTGKEILARAIHRLSNRNKQPMIKMNCAAIPASLLESDLFGHEKGAFTGATTTHIGRFEMAQGGTLFLDEIGDMPLDLQPKLLRVLQEREIERLGGNRVIPVDVRVIAATNHDLHHMVLDREFRSDLFYRLNVFPILIPPLRERPEDIPLLVHFFTRKLAARMNRNIDTIPARAMRQLCQYPWPGNVRELQNVIERAVILTRGNTLNLQLGEPQMPLSSPSPPTLTPVSTPPQSAHLLRPRPPENDENERQRILQVLHTTNGIVAGPRGAAAILGLKRTTLLSRMQRLGITAQDIV